jgi:hypothetical protein
MYWIEPPGREKTKMNVMSRIRKCLHLRPTVGVEINVRVNRYMIDASHTLATGSNSLYGTTKGLRFEETAQRPVIPLVAYAHFLIRGK